MDICLHIEDVTKTVTAVLLLISGVFATFALQDTAQAGAIRLDVLVECIGPFLVLEDSVTVNLEVQLRTHTLPHICLA